MRACRSPPAPGPPTAPGIRTTPGVRYCFRPDGATVWREMATSVSLANGAVGEKFAAHASGHWRIRFVDADATHTVTNGTEGRIEVTG